MLKLPKSIHSPKAAKTPQVCSPQQKKQAHPTKITQIATSPKGTQSIAGLLTPSGVCTTSVRALSVTTLGATAIFAIRFALSQYMYCFAAFTTSCARSSVVEYTHNSVPPITAVHSNAAPKIPSVVVLP